MDELKTQIKLESSLANQLSQEALSVLAVGYFARGKALMKEAVAASQQCQNLIQQYTQANNLSC